jgi:glycine dehydrogenase subunit 2
MSFPLVFERSKTGRRGYRFPGEESVKESNSVLGEKFSRKQPLGVPELSEVDVVRHYTNLSKRNYGVDLGFYPLGSCTMKYNPKINEDTASFQGFSSIHPLQPESTVQGTLGIMHSLLELLCEITGMEWGTLQPFAGAHGEFTGMKLFRAYFDKKNDADRKNILVPDSAHGTNPASAHISGFSVVEVASNSEGMVDVETLKEHLNDELAGIMLTNPNTLGIFEKDIAEIASLVHEAGGLLYYDGANLNPILGRVRPGDMGFDVVHLNLHKTFSTPHGGGGPGAGPVLVGKKLKPFLPAPDIIFKDGEYRWDYDLPDTIGRISGFYGNIGVLIRAFTYILVMGKEGLEKVGEYSVLNANYLKEKLKAYYDLLYPGICKHEFVLSAKSLKSSYGITAIDVAKRLLDFGVHPPTIYFPLIVPEAMMIEPTETESRETLDNFVGILETIYKEASENGELLHEAPHNTPVRRVDEVKAAKQPVLRWSAPGG